MPRVFGSFLLAVKYMAEVTAAILADDFRAAAIGVGVAGDGVGQFVVEARPAAAAVELVLRPIERSVATTTDIGALGCPVVVLAGEGAFGPFVDDHVGFFVVQRVVLRVLTIHRTPNSLLGRVYVQLKISLGVLTNCDFFQFFVVIVAE